MGDGTLVVTGNPGTNTLTISAGGSIATTYETDMGNAVPAANIIDFEGGTNINTSGATNIVTINLDPILTGLTSVTASGNFTSTGGGFSAATAVTAGTVVTAEGNITSSTGDIVATAGDIRATAGNIEALSGFVQGGNLRMAANSVTSQNTNGDINLDPDGTGDVHVITGADFVVDNGNITTTLGNVFATAGTVQGLNNVGATLGTTNVATNIAISGVTFTARGTDANIDITMVPKGTGDFRVTNGDVNCTTGNLFAAAGSLDVGFSVAGGTLYADGDLGGAASNTALTNVATTSPSSGVGTVLMDSVNNANSAGWIKIYIGTTAYWIPVWLDNSP